MWLNVAGPWEPPFTYLTDEACARGVARLRGEIPGILTRHGHQDATVDWSTESWLWHRGQLQYRVEIPGLERLGPRVRWDA